MINTPKHDLRIVRKPAAVIAMALLVGLCGQTPARAAEPFFAFSPQGPTTGQSIITPRGPAFVTGNVGSLETTMLPGSGAQGFLMNNGNGTSTLIVPGGMPQTLATPR